MFPELEYTGLQSLTNYMCLKKFTELIEDSNKDIALFSKVRPDDAKALETVLPEYRKYQIGEISAENFTIDNLGVNCDSFQCAGSTCTRACKFENKDNCPVFKIVKKVLRSQVVVTNHAYVSNMIVAASKEEDKELGIIKGRPLWICDEAHDLEGYLERAFSTEMSNFTLKNVYIPKLTRYLETTVMTKTFSDNYERYNAILESSSNPVGKELRYFSKEELERDVRGFGIIVGGISNILERYKMEAEDEFYIQAENTNYPLENLEKQFEFRDRDIEEFKDYITSLGIIKARLETLNSVDVKYVPSILTMVNDVLDGIRKFYLAHENKTDYVTYYNYSENHGEDNMFKVSATYLIPGEAMQAGLGYLDPDKTDLPTINNTKINMIGVSATLCVEGGFRDTADKLGMLKLKDIHCQCTDVGTVFDYQKQGLMYIPQQIPDVKSKRGEHFEYFKQSVRDLIEISNGGALILCTTKKETTDTYKYLQEEFEGRFTVLSADDKKWKNKNDLVKAFREDKNSILIGTRGFFQGLDVQGESLRLLCLNKLPFGSPGVVSKRKSEIAEAKGLNAFRTTAVVPTIMMLLQAVGRLIRHTKDKGVVAIYDNRLYSGANWMSPVVNSLPPFKITKDMEEIKQFFTEYNG